MRLMHYLVLCMVYTNKMFRNQFLLFSLLIALLSCSNDDQATYESGSGERFKAGVHYELLDNPTKVRDPSKIEVTEVFWFGCNHCYALEPYIARWKRDMPLDVTFIKSPATWNDMLKTHARIYYTAKALGIEQQFVPAAFNTIQNEGKMLTGKPAKSDGDQFRSQAEVVRAMSDPRYEKDPAYRQDVYDKLERSNLQF